MTSYSQSHQQQAIFNQISEYVSPISTHNNLESQSSALEQPATEHAHSRNPTSMPSYQANNQPAADDNSDPRNLLQCPAVELVGEWNEKKWDYWLYLARQKKRLNADELALANQGVMTCNNKSFGVSMGSYLLK